MLNPLSTEKQYRYRIKQASYNKEFGRPRIHTYLLTFMIGILPKVGPLRALKFKEPSEETEKIFKHSFDTIVVEYAHSITQLRKGKLKLANLNFDTGAKTEAGEYVIADEVHYRWLQKLYKTDHPMIDKKIKEYLLDYYSRSEKLRYPEKLCNKAKKMHRALAFLKTQ